jgi:hypothetical protein
VTTVIDVKKDTRHARSRTPEEKEEEKFEDPENILIIDREGSRRTIDLVEEAKVPKWEHNRRLGRIHVSRSSTLEDNQSAVARV